MRTIGRPGKKNICSLSSHRASRELYAKGALCGSTPHDKDKSRIQLICFQQLGCVKMKINLFLIFTLCKSCVKFHVHFCHFFKKGFQVKYAISSSN